MTLYIKTDGPIPEGCDYITAGNVYQAAPDDYNPETCRLFWAVGDTGDRILVAPGLPCPHLERQATWHFCDSTGTPVAAPWEGEQKCDCHLFETQCCDICQGVDGTEVDAAPINWQAHAEALAEALRHMHNIFRPRTAEPGPDLHAEAVIHEAAGKAVAAFDQAKGKA